jgi:hypothetical protein
VLARRARQRGALTCDRSGASPSCWQRSPQCRPLRRPATPMFRRSQHTTISGRRGVSRMASCPSPCGQVPAIGIRRANGLRPRRVAAFGEEGGPLSIPSPLIRVPEGTTVHVSIRNTLAAPLRIHGFCDRTGTHVMPVTVPAGRRREVRFALHAAGTFHYWATTGSRSLALRHGDDSQLGGAIVVDPPGADVRDRVFVMGLLEEGSGGATATRLTVINGRSWPHTERLEYTVGRYGPVARGESHGRAARDAPAWLLFPRRERGRRHAGYAPLQALIGAWASPSRCHRAGQRGSHGSLNERATGSFTATCSSICCPPCSMAEPPASTPPMWRPQAWPASCSAFT